MDRYLPLKARSPNILEVSFKNIFKLVYPTTYVLNTWLLCVLRPGLNTSLAIRHDGHCRQLFEFSIACDLETFCQHGDKWTELLCILGFHVLPSHHSLSSQCPMVPTLFARVTVPSEVDDKPLRLKTPYTSVLYFKLLGLTMLPTENID